MVQNIHIQINRTRFYKITKVSNPVSLKVTEYEPYDTKSNRFNRYTHVIQYTSGPDYVPSDYILCLDDPNAWYYTYILYLYEPTKKIVSVDIFFLSDDTAKKNPLIFGFNYENDPSVYYTYYYLRWAKYFTGTIGSRGLITKNDLITRLIEERGLYVSESYNKFIIRLGDKPNDSRPIIYPKSGHNTDRITLQKSEPKEYPNYVKFDHDINKLNNVESFYLSFHQDTLYMIADSSSGKLNEVHVYYNKYDVRNPVVIILKFVSRIKLYKFSDFNTDLTKKTKKISELENFSEDDLKKTLIDEFKDVKKEIKFKQGPQQNKHISVTSDRFFINNKNEFRRAILRPNLDSSNGGNPAGPFEVYNDNLFKRYSDTKIEDHILSDVIGKNFSSIYVYYTTKNEPLLVGFIGESELKFYRISKGGKSWEKEDTIKIYSDRELIPKLRKLEQDIYESDSDVQVQITRPSHQDGQTHRSTDPPLTYQPKSITTKINISKTSGSNYDSGKVQFVSKDYDSCDLFCYFLHTPSEKDFKKLSFEFGTNKTIKIDKFGENNVDSVSVFFNRDFLAKPLIMKIKTNKGEKYYRDLIKNVTEYSIVEDKSIGSKLRDTLIEENDKINGTTTCQIDLTTIEGKLTTYGHNNSINLTFEEKKDFGFGFFTHKLSAGKSFKGYVLFNKNKLVGPSNNRKTPLSIQNKFYKSIKVYVLDTDSSFPLILELNEHRTPSYYSRQIDENGEYWINLYIKPYSDDSIKSKLNEINYPLKNSAIIEIDQKNPDQQKETDYSMRMISNKWTSKNQYEEIQYEESKSVDSKNITVSYANKLTDRSITGKSPFFYVSHQLEDINIQTQSIIRRDITGLRLFMNSINKAQPEEIYLYENESDITNSKPPLFLYYPPPQKVSHKINVFFHGDDPRPLLVCYNSHGYKRFKNSDNTKWVRVIKINRCYDDPEILSTLKTLYEKMAKQVVFKRDGRETNIKKDQNKSFNGFFKDTYFPDVSKSVGPFILPKSTLLPNDSNSNSEIDKLLDQFNEQTFSSIYVYKTGKGFSLKEILVYEFTNESQKTHIYRKDVDGKYWARFTISEEITQNVLSRIKSETSDSVIYEIDKTDSGYNNSINVQPESILPFTGFNKYTHSPKDGSSKTTTILYKSENLMEKSRDKFLNLRSLENQKFTKLSVYFGRRAKDGSNNLPLIIELFKDSPKPGSSIFYKNKREDKQHYWEQFAIGSKGKELIFRLKETEFDLVNSIVVLMNNVSPKYGDVEIKNAIKQLQKSKHINLAGIDKDSIPVKKMGSVSCLTKHGFTVYEHDIYRIRKEDYLALRFLMFTSDHKNKYVNLSLYSDDNQFEEYLYYEEEYNKAYIFFYGSDPRPLLLVYGNYGFRPSLTNYDVKWNKIMDDIDIYCNSRNSVLLKELCKAVGSLNVVNLNNIPQGIPLNGKPNIVGSTSSTYDLQHYNGEEFKIKVTYENKSCYRVYNHVSNGSNGYNRGFRLGNIIFGHNQSNIGIIYNLYKQLTRVSVYYNLFDTNHRYPILVSLRFYDDSYEYYELVDKSNKFWNPIEDYVDESSVESKAYKILEKLDIKFKREKEDPTLFLRDDCSEGGNTVAVIGGSVGGVVGTAAVTGGVTVAVRPEFIITSIRALI